MTQLFVREIQRSLVIIVTDLTHYVKNCKITYLFVSRAAEKSFVNK